MNGKNELEQILLHYGVNNQMLKAVEELTELTEVLIKMVNKGDDLYHLIDEMADESIMLRQIKIACCISDEELEDRIQFKIDRQIKRINGESE